MRIYTNFAEEFAWAFFRIPEHTVRTVEASSVHRTVWKLNIHKPLHELVDEKNNGYT
ncbi:MAG: hypothetical protein MUO43_18410 [Desulfobacterales bacterium]|nr:hypothetical protein [Desulfobacterales bacterium]